MKLNTKSSITLPPDELALVEGLKKRLGAKSKVEVVRQGLFLLRDSLDRETLRAQYATAAKRLRKFTEQELAELDPLAGDALDDE